MILLVTVINGQNVPSEPEMMEELLSREIVFPHIVNGNPSLFYQFDGGAPSLFQSILSKAKLPGGVVLSNCGQSPKRFFELPYKASLGSIFTYIVTTDPDYRWEFSGGVLNLLPTKNPSTLLDMPIREFKAENVTISEAQSLLLSKPEVKKKIVEVGLSKAVHRLHILSAYIPASEDKNIPRFNFDLQGTTLRGILNEIVRNQAKKSWKYQGAQTWVYTERHCGEQTEFSIYTVG